MCNDKNLFDKFDQRHVIKNHCNIGYIRQQKRSPFSTDHRPSSV